MSRSTKSEPVALAFYNGHAARPIQGLETNGQELFLYGNRIAYREGGRLYIQASGFGRGSVKEGYYRREYTPEDYVEGDFTGSVVTLARLNMIPGVHLSRMRNSTYVNGKVWDGSPLLIEG